MKTELSFQENGIVSRKISVGIKEYTVYELDVTYRPESDTYIAILKSTFNWTDYSRNGSEPTQYRSISNVDDIINMIVFITGKSIEYAESRMLSLKQASRYEDDMPPPLKRRRIE
jgi:hypothetical protein